MIQDIQTYLSTLIPTLTFGQIQDSVDSLINLNIVETTQTQYYDEDSTHILLVNLVVRELTFDEMQVSNAELLRMLSNVYNIKLDNYRIIHTQQTGANNTPERDYKNRYYTRSTFEMIVEEI